MPDEGYGASILDSHDGDEGTVLFIAVEDHTVRYLGQKLVLGHIWLMIAVIRYVTFIGACAVVDDVIDCVDVPVTAQADHIDSSSCQVNNPKATRSPADTG
jgi:hypothetical protein